MLFFDNRPFLFRSFSKTPRPTCKPSNFPPFLPKNFPTPSDLNLRSFFRFFFLFFPFPLFHPIPSHPISPPFPPSPPPFSPSPFPFPSPPFSFSTYFPLFASFFSFFLFSCRALFLFLDLGNIALSTFSHGRADLGHVWDLCYKVGGCEGMGGKVVVKRLANGKNEKK